MAFLLAGFADLIAPKSLYFVVRYHSTMYSFIFTCMITHDNMRILLHPCYIFTWTTFTYSVECACFVKAHMQKYTCPWNITHADVSLSMIVLNGRDRHEKTCHPTLSHLHNPPHNTPYPKKLTGINWLFYHHTIPSLNSMKILTVQSVENSKIFEPAGIYLPALLP